MTPHTIIVNNVNEALPEALWFLKCSGLRSESRNGPVVVAPGPVITVYRKPTQRVLFSPVRDANPFFHFFESIWMLAGRNDVKFLEKFSPNIRNFSDDGLSLNGAYGYRWMLRWFDQIEEIVESLQKDPTSRREVLTMWTAGDLLEKDSKDLPCNTHVYVDIREGALNITVCNRSNDMWWGCYGANVVHFSVLQEFLASAIGVKVGTYIQFSNNFHLYTEVYKGEQILERPSLFDYHYEYPFTFPLVSTNWRLWREEARAFLFQGSSTKYEEDFFNLVAAPMLDSWEAYKADNLGLAMERSSRIKAIDWKVACTEWLLRRKEKRDAKEAT